MEGKEIWQFCFNIAELRTFMRNVELTLISSTISLIHKFQSLIFQTDVYVSVLGRKSFIKVFFCIWQTLMQSFI